MSTSSNATPGHPPSPVWFKIGAIVFVLVVAFVFFLLASSRLRRETHEEVPPGGSGSPKPGQVISH